MMQQALPQILQGMPGESIDAEMEWEATLKDWLTEQRVARASVSALS